MSKEEWKKKCIEALSELYLEEDIWKWMARSNPEFNNHSPDELIDMGYGQTVYDAIMAHLDGGFS